MEKVLIILEVPAISSCFEVYIPRTLRVRELAALLAQSVEDLSDHRYVSSGSELLCLAEPECLMHADALVKSYPIQNGDRLILL